MLSVLTQYARTAPCTESNGFDWFELSEQQLHTVAPFWQPLDVQRICANLREQGLILISSAPFTQARALKLAFNERSATPKPAEVRPVTAPNKNFIASNWSPDKDTLARLGQLSVPNAFALEQVPEFVNYWRERAEPAHAWGSKFMQHTIRKWREFEAQEYQRSKTTRISRDWQPSQDALNILVHHAGISGQFVEDAIPEFVLFWRERGATSDNWNKRFRDHVQRQWIRYRSALEHDTTPKRIPQNWQPSADVHEVLRLANIELTFARNLIPEFVIYWRDSNQVHSSWNTRFLQYVKQRWAKRDTAHADQTKPTRDLSLAEQLTDRTWAL